ncbi:MAG: LCP family protein [Synergistaceae bacterium]|nr:LCP family protein [Synergistaceae bacterium]
MKFLKLSIIVLALMAATAGGAALRIAQVLLPAGGATLFSTGQHRDLGMPVSSEMAVSSGDSRAVDGLVPEQRYPNSVSLNVDPILGTVNVLLVGLDEVDGGVRSDAIALAVFDQDDSAMRILSIPRDSRVFIPGRGWDKVNHAYAYGGIDLLKDTMMNLLGVGVNYFVVLNYQSFPRVIDLLGGVDIEVDKHMQYTDYSAKLFINIPKGMRHMDGKTALEYVRFRHDPLGDVGRVQRQQKFLAVVMDKVKSVSIVPKIPDLINEFVYAVNTDLTPMEGLRLAQFALSLPRERIQFRMAPGQATYIGNLSYWLLDTVEMSKWLAGKTDDQQAAQGDGLSGEGSSPPLDRDTTLDLVGRIGKIVVLNGDGSGGLGKRASQIFQKIGVDVVYTGNAKHFDYHTSNVVYPESGGEAERRAAEALAALCGITNSALIQRNRSVSMVSIVLGHDKETIFRRLEGLSF